MITTDQSLLESMVMMVTKNGKHFWNYSEHWAAQGMPECLSGVFSPDCAAAALFILNSL